MIVGTRKIVKIKPDLQAFLANDVCTGIIFARTPIEEPPKIEPIKIKSPTNPNPQVFKLSYYWESGTG